jgi:NAD(P)-dependent dehydrogenase (short-subunit alcohol dehydrogenase family)
VLGEIKPLNQTSLMEIKEVMEINVWANKEIIEALSEYAFIQQIVGISSGASLRGSKGWGAYALSKSSLNMLLKVYAKELPDIHFTALAPGVIDTAMVRHITHTADETEYPSVSRIKKGKIQSPKEAAHLLVDTFPKLFECESGSFVDVRTMED